MAKKTVDKKFLEEKIELLTEQKNKVINVLNEYSKLFDQVEGALEFTKSILKELEPDEDIKNES